MLSGDASLESAPLTDLPSTSSDKNTVVTCTVLISATLQEKGEVCACHVVLSIICHAFGRGAS